jgi:hypothetical protein
MDCLWTMEAAPAGDRWPEGKVRKISRAWQDPDGGQWWLVVFDLANLRGRIECVGVAVRSSLGPLHDVNHPLSDDEYDPDNPLWDWIDPVPFLGETDISLRPLRADTLRRLPLVTELNRARRAEADQLRRYAEVIRGEKGPAPPGLEHLPEGFEEAAHEYETPGKGRAPRIKTTQKLLERVADVYQRAWREGAVPPSAAVRQGLQVTSDQARKLVEKCRKQDPPLLPRLLPADRRKARGWLKNDPGIPARYDEWSTDPPTQGGST